MDLSNLTPADATVALRGFERRYRALFAGLDDESPDDVAHRRLDGWSAIDHVVAAARAIGAADRALAAVRTGDEPTLDAADADPAHRPHPGAPSGTVHERLSELGLEAGHLADRAAHVPASDWTRQAVVAGTSRRVNALDILRAAVEAGATHLDLAHKIIESVHGRPDRQR